MFITSSHDGILDMLFFLHIFKPGNDHRKFLKKRLIAKSNIIRSSLKHELLGVALVSVFKVHTDAVLKNENVNITVKEEIWVKYYTGIRPIFGQFG